MDLPDKILSNLPIKVGIEASISKKTIVRQFKFNVAEMEICKPTAFIRDRALGRGERLDIVHAFPNGDVRHTPIP